MISMRGSFKLKAKRSFGDDALEAAGPAMDTFLARVLKDGIAIEPPAEALQHGDLAARRRGEMKLALDVLERMLSDLPPGS